ncbi:hypothetical protein FACS1894163_01890 [Spirochaetia bacterium]|nr:hypothetical protein FACS1894163_01890 [Spirochaetia bacterium]
MEIIIMEGWQIQQGKNRKIDQQGETFGPEAVGGEEAQDNPESEEGKPVQAFQGPESLNKGTENEQKEQ